MTLDSSDVNCKAGGLVTEARISLVIGSLFRREFLSKLLASLARQSHQPYEVIIVEQDDPSSTEELLQSFDLPRAKTLISPRGLSRARNVGLAATTGDVVGFPDDDCWYLPGTLQSVANRFSAYQGMAMLCGRVMTSAGPMLPYPGSGACLIDRRNVWRTVVSPGMFVRASACEQIGPFAEDLGVGAGTLASSGEETDFALRALELGMEGRYDPLVHVFHPSPSEVGSRQSPEVGYRYGFGMGTVLRRHRYRWLPATATVVRPALGSLVAAMSGNNELRDFRMAAARGRLRGYLDGG